MPETRSRVRIRTHCTEHDRGEFGHFGYCSPNPRFRFGMMFSNWVIVERWTSPGRKERHFLVSSGGTHLNSLPRSLHSIFPPASMSRRQEINNTNTLGVARLLRQLVSLGSPVPHKKILVSRICPGVPLSSEEPGSLLQELDEFSNDRYHSESDVSRSSRVR